MFEWQQVVTLTLLLVQLGVKQAIPVGGVSREQPDVARLQASVKNLALEVEVLWLRLRKGQKESIVVVKFSVFTFYQLKGVRLAVQTSIRVFDWGAIINLEVVGLSLAIMASKTEIRKENLLT